jgi:hypothetical protein
MLGGDEGRKRRSVAAGSPLYDATSVTTETFATSSVVIGTAGIARQSERPSVGEVAANEICPSAAG